MIPYPILGLARLLKGKKRPKIRYTKGHSVGDISIKRENIVVFIRILFRLLELMFMDVVDGKEVFLDRKNKSRFFVAMIPPPAGLIAGKGLKDGSFKVDMKTTGYKMPQFAFDPGRSHHPAKVFVPEYLWEMLVDNVNKGVKYSRPLGKKFIRETTEDERYERWKKWKKE